MCLYCIQSEGSINNCFYPIVSECSLAMFIENERTGVYNTLNLRVWGHAHLKFYNFSLVRKLLVASETTSTANYLHEKYNIAR